MTVRYPYARSESGVLVHISNVDRGLKCLCLCVECGDELIANKGKVKSHYFSHKAESNCSYESLLHKTAKMVLKESVGEEMDITSFLSQYNKNDSLNYKFICPIDTKITHKIKVVELEKKITGTNMIADAVVTLEDLSIIIVEFYVTHKKTKDDINTLKKAGFNVVEVDLNELIKPDNSFNLQALKRYALGEIGTTCVSLGHSCPSKVIHTYELKLKDRNKYIKIQSVNMAKWYARNPEAFSTLIPKVCGSGISRMIDISRQISGLIIEDDYTEFYVQLLTSNSVISVRFYSSKSVHDYHHKEVNSPSVTFIRDTSDEKWVGKWGGISEWYKKLECLAKEIQEKSHTLIDEKLQIEAQIFFDNPYKYIRKGRDVASDLPIGCPPPRKLISLSSPKLIKLGVYEMNCSWYNKWAAEEIRVNVKVYADEGKMMSDSVTNRTLMICKRNIANTRSSILLRWAGFTDGY